MKYKVLLVFHIVAFTWSCCANYYPENVDVTDNEFAEFEDFEAEEEVFVADGELDYV